MPSPPEEAFIMVKGSWLHGGHHTVSHRKWMTDRHKTNNLSFSNCVKYYMLNTYYSQILLHLHPFLSWYLYSFLEIRQGCLLFFTSNNDSMTKTVLPTHSWYPYGCFECSASKEKMIFSLKHGCMAPGKNDLISHYCPFSIVSHANFRTNSHSRINNNQMTIFSSSFSGAHP